MRKDGTLRRLAPIRLDLSALKDLGEQVDVVVDRLMRSEGTVHRMQIINSVVELMAIAELFSNHDDDNGDAGDDVEYFTYRVACDEKRTIDDCSCYCCGTDCVRACFCRRPRKYWRYYVDDSMGMGGGGKSGAPNEPNYVIFVMFLCYVCANMRIFWLHEFVCVCVIIYVFF